MRSTVLSAESLASLIATPEVENVDYYLWRGMAGGPTEFPVTGATYSKFAGIPVLVQSSPTALSFGFVGIYSNTDATAVAVSQEFFVRKITAGASTFVSALSGSAVTSGIAIDFTSLTAFTLRYVDSVSANTAIGGGFTVTSGAFMHLLVKYNLVANTVQVFLNGAAVGSATDNIKTNTLAFSMVSDAANIHHIHHVKWRFYYS